ncbi:MAG: OmpH family outer membrane protein [Gammaproteobacteria bacterium]|nr:OmpH family outer membrane protein [Gammaproteobacteria bacterium]
MKLYKRMFSAMVLSAALALCAMPALAEVRIGYVNIAKLMEEAPQVKEARSRIESEFAPREKELVGLQRNIRDQEERLNRDGAVMSEAERTKLERDVLGLRRDLNRAQDEFRDDLNIRQNDALSKLQKVMFETTLALAKEQNYDLILSQGVVYASGKVDITALVLKKLNDDFRPGN